MHFEMITLVEEWRINEGEVRLESGRPIGKVAVEMKQKMMMIWTREGALRTKLRCVFYKVYRNC